MSKFITEDEIEQYNLELLDRLGYRYRYGPTIEPEGSSPERQSFGDVLLKDRLVQAIAHLNPHIPPEARTTAQRELQNIASTSLISNNETFHRYLTEGITVEYQRDGETRGEQLWLIDWNTPENNDFLAVNQFTVIEDNHNRRPDIILFINGLPLVAIELKNAADAKADLPAAFNQLQTYKREIPSLFTYNALLVISDGLSARAGSLSAPYSRFSQWKRPNSAIDHDPNTNELEILTQGMLNKSTLLDLIRHFTVFEKIKTEDPLTEVVTLQTIKKLAAYHQYHAVNKAVETVIAATQATHRGGVVWHTQGSGKSLSMVFLSGKLILSLDNPTLVVLTDRTDLDDQLFDTFAGCRQLLRQAPQQADDRDAVRQLLTVNSGGVVFTTVQKFAPVKGESLYPQISDRTNIIVLADEAHRSQYGFKAKQVTLKDADGNEIGKQTRYGFAKYIRDALPNATFVGFTGTPVEQTDKNTPEIFGDYIDIYDIAQAVEDGATVPIYYESRLVQVDLDERGRELLNELDEDLSFEDLSTTQQAKAKQTQIEAIVGSTKRLRTIAQDIVTHFEQRQTANRGKGMIVTLSRQVAANLYRLAVKPVQQPSFTNFALEPGGKHRGEALGKGRFTVLAPTIGPSGSPYQCQNRAVPVEVESLESIGIYPTQTESKPRSQSPKQKPIAIAGTIALEQLGSDSATAALRGEDGKGDRSHVLAAAYREWSGWENWTQANGIAITGSAEDLDHQAGEAMGIDTERVDRILKGIDPTHCQPAALHRGGEESCWKKIKRLDRATFDAVAPPHVRDSLEAMYHKRGSGGDPPFNRGNGGGDGGGGDGGGGDDSDNPGNEWNAPVSWQGEIGQWCKDKVTHERFFRPCCNFDFQVVRELTSEDGGGIEIIVKRSFDSQDKQVFIESIAYTSPEKFVDALKKAIGSGVVCTLSKSDLSALIHTRLRDYHRRGGKAYRLAECRGRQPDGTWVFENCQFKPDGTPTNTEESGWVYDLIKWYVPILNRLPRDHKFGLGDRMVVTLYDLLEGFVTARYAPQKLAILQPLSSKLDLLHYQTRLLLDFQLVEVKRYEYASRLLDELGRQLTGWLGQQRQQP